MLAGGVTTGGFVSRTVMAKLPNEAFPCRSVDAQLTVVTRAERRARRRRADYRAHAVHYVSCIRRECSYGAGRARCFKHLVSWEKKNRWFSVLHSNRDRSG